MYYPHPLIARQMRQFPILWLPWRRYLTATGSDAKAFEKRQYQKAERAYRLMARSYQSAEGHSIIHAIWDALKWDRPDPTKPLSRSSQPGVLVGR
jgi:hypothetical protein